MAANPAVVGELEGASVGLGEPIVGAGENGVGAKLGVRDGLGDGCGQAPMSYVALLAPPAARVTVVPSSVSVMVHETSFCQEPTPST